MSELPLPTARALDRLGATAIVPVPLYADAVVSIVETSEAVEMRITKMRELLKSETSALSLPK